MQPSVRFDVSGRSEDNMMQDIFKYIEEHINEAIA